MPQEIILSCRCLLSGMYNDPGGQTTDGDSLQDGVGVETFQTGGTRQWYEQCLMYKHLSFSIKLMHEVLNRLLGIFLNQVYGGGDEDVD